MTILSKLTVIELVYDYQQSIEPKNELYTHIRRLFLFFEDIKFTEQ